MQLKEVRIRVKKDQKLGIRTEVEPTQGFVGNTCLAATAGFEQAIGKLDGRDAKPEMGQTAEIGVTAGQG